MRYSGGCAVRIPAEETTYSSWWQAYRVVVQPIGVLRRVVVVTIAPEDRAEALVSATPADASTTFDVFFRTAKGPLLGMAFLLSGDLQVAQDLTQEAFLRAWARWGRISTYDDPQAWTRRVLYNLIVSNGRKNKIRRRVVEAPRSIPPPDESHLLLATALRSLPKNQMLALVLHDGAGLSVREVAAEMKVAEGTVKSWLSRGRASAARELVTSSTRKGEEDAH
jgi:RNA polymerase sigma-70 factor (ECF subfamily)